jgi:DNA-directed RNA polymerase sigma subunit (sigma70/sigma32)
MSTDKRTLDQLRQELSYDPTDAIEHMAWTSAKLDRAARNALASLTPREREVVERRLAGKGGDR